MVSIVNCCAISGVDVVPVSVETDISNGLPSFDMVGLLSSEVKEARERVRTAIKNSGFMISPARITINLSPANIRKSGTYFDLPIALSILMSIGIIQDNNMKNVLVAGELSLNGDVVCVNGILPMVLMASANGISKCIIPYENYGECVDIEDVQLIGVKSLNELVRMLRMTEEELQQEIVEQKNNFVRINFDTVIEQYNFESIHGQIQARKAAEIAAAGMHNLLMVGPPGTGKSLIAKTMCSIMPEMSMTEKIEISKIQSVAGNLKGNLVNIRPFRNPHHTTTISAMTGGGTNPKPGEITLAHGGMLYLDEFPEFSRAVIETLRQPLEEGKIVVSRIGGRYVFPARILMVAAMNPCRCGYYPDRNRCNCAERDIQKYLYKASGPILDRMDLCINLNSVAYSDLNKKGKYESSETIKKRVDIAASIQRQRYKKINKNFNSELEGSEIEKFCYLGKKEKELMKQIYDKFSLSVRAYGKVIKVARTIADLNEKQEISTADIASAVTFRPPIWFK